MIDFKGQGFEENVWSKSKTRPYSYTTLYPQETSERARDVAYVVKESIAVGGEEKKGLALLYIIFTAHMIECTKQAGAMGPVARANLERETSMRLKSSQPKC